MKMKSKLVSAVSTLTVLAAVISPVAAFATATTTPAAADIAVANNKGANDTITVNNVTVNDWVYTYKKDLTSLGIKQATGTSISFTGLDFGIPDAGLIYVAKQSGTNTISAKAAKTFTNDKATAPVKAKITVSNNVYGNDDTIKVEGVTDGDTVKVYRSAATTASVLGSTYYTVTSGAYAWLTVPQLGASAGLVAVTVQNANKSESTRTVQTYIAEPVTKAVLSTKITIANNNNSAGLKDSIRVDTVTAGDIVTLYNGPVSTRVASKVIGTPATSATVGTSTYAYFEFDSIAAALGFTADKAGIVYVTVQSAGKAESIRVAKPFLAEKKSTSPLAANISVINNDAGTNDLVRVSGLIAGDLVSVYTSANGGTAKTATVQATKTGATVNMGEFTGTIKGDIYVTVTRGGNLESLRVKKSYLAE